MSLFITHRIIENRIEKYDAYVVVFSKEDCHNEECIGVESKGRGAGPALPWHIL